MHHRAGLLKLPNLYVDILTLNEKANIVKCPSLMTGWLLFMRCHLTQRCYRSTQQLPRAGTQQQAHPPRQMGDKLQCLLDHSSGHQICTVGCSLLHMSMLKTWQVQGMGGMHVDCNASQVLSC